MDKTITATITKEQIAEATVNYSLQSEAAEAFERFVGTLACYGTATIVRPDFSAKADRNANFERKAA